MSYEIKEVNCSFWRVLTVGFWLLRLLTCTFCVRGHDVNDKYAKQGFAKAERLSMTRNSVISNIYTLFCTFDVRCRSGFVCCQSTYWHQCYYLLRSEDFRERWLWRRLCNERSDGVGWILEFHRHIRCPEVGWHLLWSFVPQVPILLPKVFRCSSDSELNSYAKRSKIPMRSTVIGYSTLRWAVFLKCFIHLVVTKQCYNIHFAIDQFQRQSQWVLHVKRRRICW